MIITFCGHSDISDTENISLWLTQTIENLIQQGAKTFYLGGYGGFDELVKSVLIKYISIEIVLILPYLNSNINADGYDYTLYPPIELTPSKFAILKRNQWMVEQSTTIVAYVTHNFGGATKTLTYAKRKKKNIILYPNLEVV